MNRVTILDYHFIIHAFLDRVWNCQMISSINVMRLRGGAPFEYKLCTSSILGSFRTQSRHSDSVSGFIGNPHGITAYTLTACLQQLQQPLVVS